MSDALPNELHEDILVIEDEGQVVGFALMPGSKLTLEEAAEMMNRMYGLPILPSDEIEDFT